jgi:anti-anti-sigma regulatory factor
LFILYPICSERTGERKVLMESYKIKSDDETLNIELNENIDEHSSFEGINVEKYKKVVVDFNNVHLMNSCGIREWVKFVIRLNKSQLLVFKNCPYIIIDTLSTIPAFTTEQTYIKSVLLDWECHNTKSHKITTFDIDSDTFIDGIPCDNCSESMTTEGDWPELIEDIRQKNSLVKG